MGTFTDLTGQVFHGRRVERYLGKSLWECKCLKCGQVSTCTTVQAKSYGCRNCWRNHVNDDYFKVIDSAEKAYFLGFLWADGYCSVQQHVCKIDVQESDRDILEKMIEAFEFTGRITSYMAKLGQSYRSQESVMYRLAITNPGFIQVATNQGIAPHREDADFPYQNIPKQFYRDFIRGYFDGNGGISFSSHPTKSPMVSICGGTRIVHEIGNIISNAVPKAHVKFYPRHPENPFNDTLKITFGQSSVLDYLYANASVYLDRKYRKYLQLLKMIPSSNDYRTDTYEERS